MNQFLNNKKNKNGWIKIITGVVVLILFVGILNLSSARIRNFFYSASLPAQKVFLSAGNNVASIAGSILNYKNLDKENTDLKNENQKLLYELSLLQDLSLQSQAVKDILNCSQPEDFKLILTNVTGFNSDEDLIMIDKGKVDGISENMSVISQEKVLFGKVLKVYKNFSQVMLISNKNSTLDVQIQKTDLNPPAVYGAIKGNGGLSVYLDLVPTDSEINSGDLLVTSALEGVFPKNLIIGRIEDKNKNDLKPFQTATVKPFFDIKKTGKLFVITNYRQEN